MMFYTHNRINQITNRISLAEILSGVRFSNIEEMQYRLNYILRNRQEHEDEEALIEEEHNSNANHNFMKEKDINFRLYPFYINWKKLETNESDYYHTFIHYGYFGASIYSLYKEKYPTLSVKNIIFILSNFISEYLLNKENKEESKKEIKDFFDKIPNLDDICQLIKNKIIMMKEVPIILIVLKIYEINFMITKNNKEIEKVLKNQYLLGNYLNDNEYSDIFKNHFRGKIIRIFNKISEDNGKEFELPKTKKQFNNHIKYVYKKYIKNE